MIKFFRNIRYSLMEQNKTSKYLKYAIGEIVLVVIGILIALQINNWNEDRKLRRTEMKLLLELKENLFETKEDLKTDIDKAINTLEVTDSLYQSIVKNKKQMVSINMDYIYEVPLLFPKLSAYKSIQSYGVNIISNDSLRKMITSFYELQLERVKFGELIIRELNEQEIKPYLDEISIPESQCEKCESLLDLFSRKNFYFIKKGDTKLIHFLKEKFLLLDGLNNRYTDTKQQIENMINAINNELKS